MANSLFDHKMILRLEQCDVIYYDFLRSQVVLKNKKEEYSIHMQSLNRL